MIKIILTTLALLFLFIGLQSCSSKALKQATHDTMENMKRQECERSMRDDCGMESYDEYQRKRKESTQ